MDMREPETMDTPRAEAAGRSRRALGVGVMLTVVIALVAGFGALALARQGKLTLPPQLAPGSTADWQTYHDPLGLFTMRLPPGWTASVEMGSFTQGDRNGSDSGQDEMIRFSDLAQGKTSAVIFVYAQPIHDTAVAQSMMCGARGQESGTFQGYPASTQPALILFESGNAHFQIDEVIPGVLAPANPGGPMIPSPPPPTPTPLSASTISTHRALLSDALASFYPTDAQPLACH